MTTIRDEKGNLVFTLGPWPEESHELVWSVNEDGSIFSPEEDETTGHIRIELEPCSPAASPPSAEPADETCESGERCTASGAVGSYVCWKCGERRTDTQVIVRARPQLKVVWRCRFCGERNETTVE